MQDINLSQDTIGEILNKTDDNFDELKDSTEKNERAVQAEKNERIYADNFLSTRINNLVGNTGNSNSEIVDARVGVDGTVYPSAGDAVRQQVGALKGDLVNLGNNGSKLVEMNAICNEIVEQTGTSYVKWWAGGVDVSNLSKGDTIYYMIKSGRNLLNTEKYGHPYVTYTTGAVIHLPDVTELNKWYACTLIDEVDKISWQLFRGYEGTSYEGTATWDVIIIKDKPSLYNFKESDDIEKAKKATRIFQPKFYHSLQSLSSYVDNFDNFKTMIDTHSAIGVDGFVICITLKWEDGVLTNSLSDDFLKNACDYIVSTGKTIFAWKIHCTTYDNTDEFKTAYEAELIRLATLVKNNKSNWKLYRFIIFNECQLLLDKANADWCTQVVTNVANAGVSVSISYDLLMFGIGRISNSIVSKLGFLCFNYYPPIGNKGKGTTYNDCLEAWKNSRILKAIKTYKFFYPNKDIYISETGIGDYYNQYGNPSKCNLTGDTQSNGITQRNYLQACMEVVGNDVSAICSWYEINKENTVPMLKRYLGEVD